MPSGRAMLAAVVVLAFAFPAVATASTVTPSTDVGMISAMLEQAGDLFDVLIATLFGGMEEPVPTPGDLGSPPVSGEPQASSSAPPADPSGTALTGSGGDESSGPWPVSQP